MNDSERARLQIRRRKGGWRDFMREYRIEVDGQSVGTLRRGQTLAVDVTPGVHAVQARIDWTGSPELRRDFEAGSLVALIVGSNGSPFKGPFQVFSKESWLTLAQDQD